MTVLPMSEAQLQRAIVALARQLGWRVLTINAAAPQRGGGFRTPFGADGVGWPDAFMVRGEWALAVELKVGRNKPSVLQEEWIAALIQVPGILGFVWHSDDWVSGYVERVLRDPLEAAA